MTTDQLVHILEAPIAHILKQRRAIATAYAEVGGQLKKIKEEGLYRQAGFASFSRFLSASPLGITPLQADRLIRLSEDQELRTLFDFGVDVALLALDLPMSERLVSWEILTHLPSPSPKKAKEILLGKKRQNKIKCDRCARWIEHAREIDGKFYGASGSESCYEREMEDRRILAEGEIPAPQLDRVLDLLRESLPQDRQQQPLNAWLPERLYVLFGNLLHSLEPESASDQTTTFEHLSRLTHLLQQQAREAKQRNQT